MPGGTGPKTSSEAPQPDEAEPRASSASQASAASLASQTRAWAEQQPLAEGSSTGSRARGRGTAVPEAVASPSDATQASSVAGTNGGLWSRLQRLERAFADVRRHLSGRSKHMRPHSYAAEWFLDNYYLVRDSLRQVRHDLPERYFAELPRLAPQARLAGSPRVYALALELVESSDAQLDAEHLEGAVAAYQRVAPLTMGELWALPTMLRLALLVRLAESLERLTDARAPKPSAGVEAPDQRVANCIMGLRAIKTRDWRRFFERLSLVEHALRGDPDGSYGAMDFDTRDRYRKVIERLAKGAGMSEPEVAMAAVALAEAGASVPDAPARRRHVGAYLVAEGLPALRRQIGYRTSLSERASRWLFGHASAVYLGSIGVLSAALVLGMSRFAVSEGAGAALGLLAAVVALVPALTIAVGLVNLVLGKLVPPRVLPKMDFRAGIPDAYRTAVVVPAMLTDAAEVDALLEHLERHYLGNPQPQMSFALLTDFVDAQAATMEGDEALLRRAMDGVRALNDRYAAAGVAPFYLLHRERRWNPSEGVWMGWERKRGKLAEFNRLLRRDADTSFKVQVGDLSRLAGVRFVLTLDADTRLPPDAARRLIGTLAHPLNRAVFDHDDRVVAGYSLLQPRTEVLPESANRSRFSRLFVGDIGLDPYTLAVSDVYHDFFGQGIYVGKGLYDVDDFSRALAGRMPENAILSHDLLEGLYAGVGLVSDVLLFEEYPAHYLAQVLRSQRWVRGDWQLLPWLLSPPHRRRTGAHLLGVMGTWKIFDNLRRSLLMPSLLLLFALAWTLLPPSALGWTLFGLLSLAVPLSGGAVTTVADGLLATLDRSERALLPWRPLLDDLRRYLVTLSFVPFEALVVTGSIVITLYRLTVTRRHLLRWRTAASAARVRSPTSAFGMAGRLAAALAVTLVLAALVLVARPAAILVAAPLLGLWLVSPWIAHAMSLVGQRAPRALDAREQERLRLLARRTWLYFERFVGPEDNWLPPDNVQRAPRQVTAHRTSPTNIGLLLLSTLAAHDLGYVGILDLSLRLRQTLEGLDRMEHYRGHLLNWYDTRNLQPLAPRYVSSVDSGNLACSLVTLRQGCRELIRQAVVPEQRWRGLLDAMGVLASVLKRVPAARGSDLERRLAGFDARLREVAAEPRAWAQTLASVRDEEWRAFEAELIELTDSAPLAGDVLTDLRLWTERVRYNLRVTQREFEFLMPWWQRFADADAVTEAVQGDPEARAAWLELQAALELNPPLNRLPDVCAAGKARVEALRQALRSRGGDGEDTGAQAARGGGAERQAASTEADAWCKDLARQLVSAEAAARGLLESYAHIADLAERRFRAMDFRFLFDEERQLLHIGYNVDNERLDANEYDLLASEARLASFIAIAKNDLPVSHWLHLGRPLADLDGRGTLLSWSGTMFEYLMPDLLMRSYPGTLLTQSNQSAVATQMAYARRQGVPWGISESGYARVDASGTYQYRAFGVPELAFQRDREDDLVIAPYASVLATPYRPEAVMSNLEAFEEAGAVGHYGLFEALDYTPARRPLNADMALVRSHMAHHQGMILVALGNALSQQAMVRRFHSDPRVATVELLLQERVPTQVPVVARPEPLVEQERVAYDDVRWGSWQAEADAEVPSCHVLSNGRFSVLLTASGSGYSGTDGMAITRWRADTTLEDDGSWLYLRDLPSGALRSVCRQPVGAPADQEQVLFWPHMAEFQRTQNGIRSVLRVVVAEVDAEVRQVELTNQGEEERLLEVCSYAEVALGPQAADQRHPAFSKLFVESEYLPELDALLFRRRPRGADERPLYAAHMLIPPSKRASATSYETDRARFLGRGRDARSPLGPVEGLSGTTGATLDPVMALATRVRMRPHSRTSLSFVTATAPTRGELLETLRRLRAPGMVRRSFEAARERSLLEMRSGELDVGRLASYQRLLSALLYPSAALRAPPEVLAANRQGQPALWGQAISGDYPILLVRVKHQEETPLVAELVRAHGYWRRRGVKVDVVVLNTRDSAYDQELQGQLRWVLSRTGGDDWLNARGGIYLLRADQIDAADLTLLESAAAVVLDGGAGPLATQLEPLLAPTSQLPLHRPSVEPEIRDERSREPARPTDLRFDNGIGGFSADGREYVVYLEAGGLPPAPWSNVVANPSVGFLATEAGLGSSWCLNSGENRLTPWSNDPVTDPPSEVVYLRDEETAEVWSATPAPCGGEAPTVVRHGAGYTTYERQHRGLRHVLRAFVADRDPVKLVTLEVRNLRKVPRRVTVTYYAPWALGVDHQGSQRFVIPEYSAADCALLARNPYNAEFGERVAFLASNKTPHGVTTDRTEFLGRLGSLADPAGLRRIGLRGTVRAGVDPCAVLQLHLDLPAEGAETVVFALGQAEGREAALRLADAYRDVESAPRTLEVVRAAWDERLDQLRVDTPDPAMDLLLNRWALYQTMSCRIWGRSAFYQSSGAYGFRDQLQDVLGVLHTEPELAREQLLRASAHQFQEGDVLHWWHPPSGRGVRTRITDDLLWLPYVTCAYIEATGDVAVLSEERPFLMGEPLRPEEHERYAPYGRSDEKASLLEHCRRAIARGSTKGPHDLPLMGGGDWNDGMNRVGIDGKGESVWLGWFLVATLRRFADLNDRLGDAEAADAHRRAADAYVAAIERVAWDGDWYLRAYYDDGTPLGSHADRECRIDSIAQSWSVLSGAGDPERARRAMRSVEAELVKDEDGLIRLFTPAFDDTVRDPGYVKGYLPGVRENGGQYTHGALWAVWAFAELGDGDRAGQLFELLNPVRHGGDPAAAERYKVEPYVIAADVYSLEPHVGRGGWTWYTGSGAWFYRLGIEGILGLQRTTSASAAASLRIDPSIPSTWPGFRASYREGSSRYHIEVDNAAAVCSGVRLVTLDGDPVPNGLVPLRDDGAEHRVRVVLG